MGKGIFMAVTLLFNTLYLIPCDSSIVKMTEHRPSLHTGGKIIPHKLNYTIIVDTCQYENQRVVLSICLGVKLQTG